MYGIGNAILILSVLALALQSCKKDSDDNNNNNNTPKCKVQQETSTSSHSDSETATFTYSGDNITQLEVHYDDPTKNIISTYTYNSDGYITSQSSTFPNDSTHWRSLSIYTYGGSSSYTIASYFINPPYTDTTYNYTQTVNYNANGEITGIQNDDGYSETYSNYVNGNVGSKASYNGGGTLLSREYYTYDNNTNHDYSPKSKTPGHTALNNIVLDSVEQYYLGNTYTGSQTYTYTLNSNGYATHVHVDTYSGGSTFTDDYDYTYDCQ